MKQLKMPFKYFVISITIPASLIFLSMDTYAVKDEKRELSVIKEKKGKHPSPKRPKTAQHQNQEEEEEEKQSFSTPNNNRRPRSIDLERKKEEPPYKKRKGNKEGCKQYPELPPELWDVILSDSVLNKKLIQISLTCKTFNELTKERWIKYALAKGITLSKLEELVSPSENSTPLPTLVRYKEGVKGIELVSTGEKPITNDTLQLLASFPNMRSLYLRNCTEITDEGIKEIGKNCKNLTRLGLINCTQITDEGIEKIAKNYKNIRACP